MSQIAVIADIHGNRFALEAVLQDLKNRQIETIFNLGDSLYGPLDPSGTADLLMPADFVTVSGNQDRILFNPPEEVRDSPRLQIVIRQLTDVQLNWLRQQPATAVYEDILFCHGTPHSDDTYLLEKVTPHGVFLNDEATIRAHLEGTTQPVICCGHTHIARVVSLSDGRLIVNPGSVGLTAYSDDLPYPHAMESGSPHARYAILSGGPGRWTVDLIAVHYDWQAAAALANQNGRPDWAHQLLTGRV